MEPLYPVGLTPGCVSLSGVLSSSNQHNSNRGAHKHGNSDHGQLTESMRQLVPADYFAVNSGHVAALFSFFSFIHNILLISLDYIKYYKKKKEKKMR